MSYIPVLIIGAGPSGLAAACELRRHGVPFRILDKKPEATKTSNAAAIQPRTLEILHQMGLIERFLARGTRNQGADVYLGSATESVVFNEIHSTYPYILMLAQSETEAILNDRLAEWGIYVERSTTVNRILPVDGRYEISLTKEGRNEVLVSDWIIAADGAHSITRQCFNIPFVGDDIQDNFLVADVKLAEKKSSVKVQLYIHSGKILGMFPLGEYHRLVANAIDHKPPYSLEMVESLVRNRTGNTVHVSDLVWVSPFWIHSRVAKNLRLKNVFFIGDSGHIHSPVGGQGMNTGIQDAHNLAWKLALVLRGEANANLLNSYEAERLPVIENIVRTTEKMTKVMISHLPGMNWVRRALFYILAHSQKIREKMSNRVGQLTIRYEKSEIINYTTCEAPDDIKPGLRAPDVIISGTMHLFDYFKHPRHTILIFTGHETFDRSKEEAKVLYSWLRECYDHLMQAYIIVKEPIDIEQNSILDNEGHLHKAYGASGARLCIVRPDGVIGLYQSLLDEEAIQDYFVKLLK